SRDIVSLVRTPGRFQIHNVPLDPGLNVISAVATDDAGNDSAPSEPISLTRDLSQLPDVAIATDDVVVYPPYPLPGDRVQMIATVQNRGASPANNVDIAFLDNDANGSSTLIGSIQTIAALAPGE